jgi:hypothetical protein
MSVADDIDHIKELAGFANIFYPDVEPGLVALYTNTAILGWFLSFQVGRKLKGKTIALHGVTARKVLEWIEAQVCPAVCRAVHHLYRASGRGQPLDLPYLYPGAQAAVCLAGQQPDRR